MKYHPVNLSSPSEHGNSFHKDNFKEINTVPSNLVKSDEFEEVSNSIELSTIVNMKSYDKLDINDEHHLPRRKNSSDSDAELLPHYDDIAITDTEAKVDTTITMSFENMMGYIHSQLFPQNRHPNLQIWRLENLALPLSYLLVGTMQGLSTGVMTVFLLQINASESQQLTILSLRALPAAFKILFGLISDSCPLFGYRRKCYMLLGWLLASICMLLLSVLERNVSNHNTNNPPDQHNIQIIAVLYFLFGFGFWLADVVADSIMTEKGKLESGSTKGQLQATCYAIRFFALMVSITLATFLYDYMKPSYFFFILGILPWITIFPSIYFFSEEIVTAQPSIWVLFQDVWDTVCTQATWQPLGFIFIYQSLQVSNAAWKQYLYTVLHFSSVQINSLLVVSYIILYISVMIYRNYLRQVNYRVIYFYTIIVNTVFSVLQVLLILQVNQSLGISDYLFALGDDAVAEFVYGIQYLPFIILMSQLCPKGSEGTSFALFTSVNNSAMQVSSMVSTRLLSIWNVSKSTMQNGHLHGMTNLTVLTSVIQFSGVFFLRLMPTGIDDVKSLDYKYKSAIGGAVVLFITFAAILFSISTSILNIVNPHWGGGS